MEITAADMNISSKLSRALCLTNYFGLLLLESPSHPPINVKDYPLLDFLILENETLLSYSIIKAVLMSI